LIAPTIRQVTTISATVNHSGLRASRVRNPGASTLGAISTTMGVVMVCFMGDSLGDALDESVRDGMREFMAVDVLYAASESSA
jgi:hypothetical protein